MRRLWLLALALAVTASARAQTGPGTIHYKQTTPDYKNTYLYRIPGAPGGTPYRVQDLGPISGANNPNSIYFVTDLKYGPPGSETYRYTYGVDVGGFTDPATGSTTMKYGDYYAVDERTRTSTQLTRFRGPLVTTTLPVVSRWSEERRDNFFGLLVTDTTTGRRHVVRTWVSATDMFTEGFQPLTESDLDPTNPEARLELVATFPKHMVHFWNADGSGILYLDDRNPSRHVLRFHPVGGISIDQDPAVFDQGLTGLRPISWEVSPTTGQLVVQVSTISGTLLTDPSGLVVVNPYLPGPNNWNWLLKETTGKAGLDALRSPFFSPDGTVVGFTGDRKSNGKVAAKGVYRIPVGGGMWTAIREDSSRTPTAFAVLRWTW